MINFKKQKYLIIKKAISTDMANFIYGYFSFKRRVAKKFFDERYISPFTTEWGVWNDEQVPDTYSHYADIVMETLLEKVRPRMEKETNLKLIPTYSYARIYKTGDVLKRHKDRFSCEISATMFLGGESWELYIEPSGQENKKGIKVIQKRGDILIYSGCELEHWREAFKGKNCCQVFLHYNKAGSTLAKKNKFDGREFLGLPSYFKT
jgi:hypothetical protein|tara:strand:- start:1365 stop:1985 length:621 start_codon:yes stop_codon:yes gene_type:complete